MLSKYTKLLSIITLFMTGCSPAETPTNTAAAPVQTQEQSVVSANEQPKGDSANPTAKVDIPRLTGTIAPAMAHSAMLHFGQQSVVTEPSAVHIQYLMRAARYREAADYATRASQSDSIRFLTAKARVLANLCSESAPCASDFEHLKPSIDDLKPIIEFWRIRAIIADHKPDLALSAIEKYLSSTKNTAKARALILEFDKIAQKIDFYVADNAKLLEKLNALTAKVRNKANAFESASLTHIQLDIETALGREKTAAAKRSQLVLQYPATQMSLWPELAGSPQDLAKRYSPSERMSRINRLISHFDYDNARRELKQLTEDSSVPQTTRTKAEWELAKVSMTNAEEPGLSEKIYRKWAKQSGPNQEEAVFGISRALSRQLKYPEAIKALQNYDKQYPKGKYKSRSLYLRGWYLFDLRKNEAARPLLKEYAEKTNDTAVWGFYAQTFIRDERWKDAIQAFENLKHNQNPIVRGKALYWQAYAEHQLNRDENAQKRLSEIHKEFPLTWYDILAYQREEDWFGKNADDAYRKIFRIDADPRQDNILYAWGYGSKLKSQPNSEVWQRIKTLSQYDAIEEARSLYTASEKALLNAVPAENRDEFRRYATHLVEAYHDAWEECSGSVRALSHIVPSRSNPRHKMAYPQPFAPLVESLAADYGLPHYFIFGIMLQESRFRPWQVSSADAIGALQMIPKTARPIAKALGLEYHPDTFFDPRVGFPYSAYYMKMHYDRWGHNLAFTAGSYNGGPHRIGPWALRDKGKTIDFIVDEFSFDESRHYARKVVEHTLRFAYLYAHSTEEWIDVVHKLVPRIVPDIDPTDDWGL